MNGADSWGSSRWESVSKTGRVASPPIAATHNKGPGYSRDSGPRSFSPKPTSKALVPCLNNPLPVAIRLDGYQGLPRAKLRPFAHSANRVPAPHVSGRLAGRAFLHKVAEQPLSPYRLAHIQAVKRRFFRLLMCPDDLHNRPPFREPDGPLQSACRIAENRAQLLLRISRMGLDRFREC